MSMLGVFFQILWLTISTNSNIASVQLELDFLHCYLGTLKTEYPNIYLVMCGGFKKKVEINIHGDLNKENGDAKNLQKLISVVPRLFGT